MVYAIWLEPNSDKNIIFSFSRCQVHRKFCIRNLSDEELVKFYRKLWEYEWFSLQYVCSLPNKSGWTYEHKDSDGFKELAKYDNTLDNYYHFRVGGKARIFWWTDKNRFYILKIDPNWEIYHKSHK